MFYYNFITYTFWDTILRQLNASVKYDANMFFFYGNNSLIVFRIPNVRSPFVILICLRRVPL